MMRLLTASGFLICAILGAAGCTDSAKNTDSVNQRDVIRRGNIEPAETLDPALAEQVHTFNILIDLYEGLVAEAADGQIVPGVAESWSVSEDGLVYTFKLRAAARWSNGERLIANDFVNGLRRVASSSTPSGFAFLLEPIVNFARVKSGDLPVTDLGVSAIDESTLAIRLSKPTGYFLGVLAMPIAFPLYGDGSNQLHFQEPRKFIGNGAYVLAEHSIGGPSRLKRNDLYWEAHSVEISEVVYFPVVDEVAELNMYRSGELDITASIPPNHIAIARKENPDEIRIAPSLALYYLAFDLTEPPFDNIELRQALSIAIDREQLTALLGRGEQPAFGIVPEGVANYRGPKYAWQSATQEERHDIARELYEFAGYTAKNPLRMKLTYDVGSIHEQVALAVSAMWKEVLGVETELDKKEWKYFLDTRENRSAWQVMRFSWFGDYNDATTFSDIFYSASAQNLPRYANAEYDRLISDATVQTNIAKRAVLLQQAEQLLLDDYPIAPLYFYVSKHMVKPYVIGFEGNILDRHPSKYLRFERR